MIELQVPLLAAKALILLLLFAFIYAVMARSIGDLRKIPDDEPYVPGQSRHRNGRGTYRPRSTGVPEFVVEDSDILAPETRFEIGDGETSVGRSSGSNIVLRSDDYASGRHAQLTRHGGLNGRKTVGATPLRHGDTVRVGSTTFRYEE
jgi:hypothetical protein